MDVADKNVALDASSKMFTEAHLYKHSVLRNGVIFRIERLRIIIVYLDYLKKKEVGGEDDGYDFGSEPIVEHFKFNGLKTRKSELSLIPHGCGETVLRTSQVFSRSREGQGATNNNDFDACNVEYCELCGWWGLSRKTTEFISSRAYETSWVNCVGIPMSFPEQSSPAVAEISGLIASGHKQLSHTSPKTFEAALSEVFKNYYHASEVRHVGGPNDQGIDIYAVIDEHTHLIQVKRRINGKAESVSTVRDLLGAYVLAQRGIRTNDHSAHIITSAPSISNHASKAINEIPLSKYNFSVFAHDYDALVEMVGFAMGSIQEPWTQLTDQWMAFEKHAEKIQPHSKYKHRK